MSLPLKLLALAALAPFGGHQDAPKAYPAADMYRPTPMPDRITLNWCADPATTQAVTWRTDTSAARAVAQIAPADPSPYLDRLATTVEATTQSLATDLGFTANYHSVNFTGLRPNSQYVYRVGDGTNWSEWFGFRTTSDKAEPFSFVYFGDVQNGIRSLWSRVVRRAYHDAPDAKFFLYAGDLINRSNDDSDWGEMKGGPGWVNGSVPSIPAIGNHEYQRNPQGEIDLSYHWRPEFTLPENGPKGLEETVYSIDIQGARIIVLNSHVRQADQVPWLEERLRNNPNRWTIVTFHHPILSSAKGRDNKELRDLWKPVFDKYKVDLVLQGHDHTYARAGFSRVPSSIDAKQKSGTMYVVSVSGSKMYDLVPQDWMERRAEDTQLYQIVRVERDRIVYEARTATGEKYDAFELRKRVGKPNALIDQKPRTPERRRPATKPAER
jgi:3',5'-cyclic AMP phosphodiesterase CpdA